MNFVWNVIASPGTARLNFFDDSWLRCVVMNGRCSNLCAGILSSMRRLRSMIRCGMFFPIAAVIGRSSQESGLAHLRRDVVSAALVPRYLIDGSAVRASSRQRNPEGVGAIYLIGIECCSQRQSTA